MPTLQFKGKTIIWNHHLSVPYHALEDNPELAFHPNKAKRNLIIQGDNLLALKALLPLYGARVKCIYIDPPYNTGNEKWVYNDNVNSPLLHEWLGKEVGKDDLTRHDKWLCMMTPRLKLLRELLADNGVIFISIDDNEQASLKSIMDEIFGESNFMGNLPRRTKSGGGSAASDFAIEHDYVLAYAKEKNSLERLFIPHDPDYAKRFSEEDGLGNFYWDTFQRSYTATKPYKITAPDGTILEGDWFRSEDTYQDDLKRGEIRFLKKKDGNWSVQFKQRIGQGRKLRSLIENEFKSSTKDLEDLGMESDFTYPKPVTLVKELIHAATFFEGDAVILDSFAGSGTTAQAVMELNKEETSQRTFILVQMTEATPQEPTKNVCQNTTRKRVKLAIEKHGYDTGFAYVHVGAAMDADTLLAGKLPPIEQFGRYLFYLCTGEKSDSSPEPIEDHLYLLGSRENLNVYLIYSQEFDQLTRLALNLEMAEKIKASSKKRSFVYAPACFLDEDYLHTQQIEFVNIPYGIFQRTDASQ